MPAATRTLFEPRFGAEFSHVRVHTGGRANATAKAISAKAFAVKTRNGSCVTAKMAGIESTAKMMSVVSTSTRTASSGVASHFPPCLTQNRCPWYSSVVGTAR